MKVYMKSFHTILLIGTRSRSINIRGKLYENNLIIQNYSKKHFNYQRDD